MTTPVSISHAVKITSLDGEHRVKFTPLVIRAAHVALLGVGASFPIVQARQEATSYYTSDKQDAIDTSIAMWAAAQSAPQQLIHERDLPTELRLLGPSPEQMVKFHELCQLLVTSIN